MSCANSFAFDFGRGKPARRLGIYFHAPQRHAVRRLQQARDRAGRRAAEGRDAAAANRSRRRPDTSANGSTAIKSRKEPSCSVNYHYKVDLAMTLANLSYKLGRSVRFDPEDGEDRRRQAGGEAGPARLPRPVEVPGGVPAAPRSYAGRGITRPTASRAVRVPSCRSSRRLIAPH